MSMKRFTLLADGASDRVLIPMLRWLIGQLTNVVFESQWADLGRLRKPPRGLEGRIRAAIEYYPCDMLLVHRDAERDVRETRVAEIIAAAHELKIPVVSVVPVRMQEAWLLFNEQAIRLAAGCPNGVMPINMPIFDRIEDEPDPKEILHRLLVTASGLVGRRAKQFRPGQHAHRLAELLDDWSPLRNLAAFQAMEDDLASALRTLGCELVHAQPATKARPARTG